LVQFALMFFVLIGFLALAVDMGNAYVERRRMQNAADAAALAGAREMCLGQSEATVRAAAVNYLVRNGMTAADITTDDIQIISNRVVVTAHESVQTLIAHLLGVITIDVDAEATASCTGANTACGLWPISFDLNLYAGVQCGQPMVVWNAAGDTNAVLCEIDGAPHEICDCYDCDLDNNGSDDFVVVTDIARGWMDFPSSNDPVYTDSCKAEGCGASELACRLRNGSGGRVELPACIPGLRGVKASAKDDVDARRGEVVQVGLYSGINCATGSNCSGTDAESYYISSFGCVSVGGWVQSFTLNPKPGMSNDYKRINSKAIIATKECNSGSCVSFCGVGNGAPAAPWELRAAGLTD
jgi:hypothetical protein